jgi:hypothetical protein
MGPDTGNGTCMTPSRARTGWATPTRWNIWRARPPRRSTSWNITACRFQPHRRGQDLPAPLRRPHHRIRRRPAGAAHLRRGRPDRPRHPAHALRPVAEEQRRILHRIFRARPDHHRWPLHRRRRWKLDDGTIHVFNAKMVVLATGGYGRAYFSATSRPYLHRRRRRHGGPRGPAACRTWSSCSSTRPASMARAA